MTTWLLKSIVMTFATLSVAIATDGLPKNDMPLILKPRRSETGKSSDSSMRSLNISKDDSKRTDRQESLSKSSEDDRRPVRLQKLGVKEIDFESYEKEGGIHGGGGNFVVLPSGQKILLDLYLKDPSLSFLKPVLTNSMLPATPAYRSLGMDRIDPHGPLIQKTRKLISKWAQHSPRMTAMIDQALTTVPFIYVAYKFNIQDQNFHLPAHAPKTVSKDSILTAVVYFDEMGAWYSKPDLDSLDELNLMATLIHESVRHLQIYDQYRFSNQQLQDITAAFVLDTPSNILDHYLPKKAEVTDPELQKFYQLSDAANELDRAIWSTKTIAEAKMKAAQAHELRLKATDLIRMRPDHGDLVNELLKKHPLTTNRLTIELREDLESYESPKLYKDIKAFFAGLVHMGFFAPPTGN